MIRFVSLIPNPRERYGDSFSPKLLDRLVARDIKPSMTSPTPHGESEQTGFGHPPNKIKDLASGDLSISPPPPVGEANEKKDPLFFNKNNTLARHCEEPTIYWGDAAIHTPTPAHRREQTIDEAFSSTKSAR